MDREAGSFVIFTSTDFLSFSSFPLFDQGKEKNKENYSRARPAVSGVKNVFLHIRHHGLFSYALTADFLIFSSILLSFVSCELLAKSDTSERKKSKKMLRNLLDDAPENSP
jgi:hypothetical protein